MAVECLESFGRKSAYFSSVEPFETDQYSVLGVFPVPGDVSALAQLKMRFLDRTVHFDDFGEFYFYSQIGAFKLLLTDRTLSRHQFILDLFKFVARNSVHSSADYWKYQLYGLNRAFNFSSLVRKLFFSDQPLMLQCGGVSEFLISLFHYCGIESRLVHLVRGENLDGHVVVEAFDHEARKWIFLDADYGVALMGERGLLSAEDVFDLVSRGDFSFSVIDFGNKCWLRPERNFPLKFVGEATWTPADNSAARCAESTIYKSMLGNYVRILNRYEYKFTSPWCGERFPEPLATR